MNERIDPTHLVASLAGQAEHLAISFLLSVHPNNGYRLELNLLPSEGSETKLGIDPSRS